MNVSIGLDYSSFCNHYYAEAEKMADITVAGYVKTLDLQRSSASRFVRQKK